MKKLARYLKPFAGTLALALVLLFVQASLDLNLPNLMSNIVNVGIQQGGITEAAPQAVPESMLKLLEYFMPAEDAELVEQQYLYADDLTGEARDAFLEQWPEAASIPHPLSAGGSAEKQRHLPPAGGRHEPGHVRHGELFAGYVGPVRRR